MYSANSLKAELNDRGWRLTPQRETILNVFQNLQKGKHLSAEDLYNLLEEQGEPISLSTIYRTVKLMARMGILRELEFAEGHKHYELNQPYPYHHHHLICVKCNKTIEFKSDSVLKIGSKTAKNQASIYWTVNCRFMPFARNVSGLYCPLDPGCGNAESCLGKIVQSPGQQWGSGSTNLQ